MTHAIPMPVFAALHTNPPPKRPIESAWLRLAKACAAPDELLVSHGASWIATDLKAEAQASPANILTAYRKRDTSRPATLEQLAGRLARCTRLAAGPRRTRLLVEAAACALDVAVRAYVKAGKERAA